MIQICKVQTLEPKPMNMNTLCTHDTNCGQMSQGLRATGFNSPEKEAEWRDRFSSQLPLLIVAPQLKLVL